MAPRLSLHADLSRLDGLISQLPFDLDDGEAVGELYAEWLRSGSASSHQLLDLWTYCYVRRYYLMKFVRSAQRLTASDLEMVIELAFKKIASGRGGIRDAGRYPRWVIVVCRNTFVNYVTRNPAHISVERVAEPQADTGDLEALHDDAIRASALDAAIARLPRYLRKVARLRLVQDLEYEVIATRTRMSVASVRAYLHKSLVRLRADRRFLDAMGYDQERGGSKEQ